MKLAVTVLRYIIALAQSPIGRQAIMQLGGPWADLLVTYGLTGLQDFLATWSGPEFTDEDVRTHLAAKGLKVIPFDPASLFPETPA